MADKISMNTQDAVSANFAECFVTLNGTRYSMLMAKEFEGKASINTKEVYRLGNPVIGHKAQTIALAFSMTVYKCTEIFDQVVEDFIKTGVMPTFDIQTSNDDPATSVGRSTKIYNNCVLDGDVLLSMFNAEGDFVEQTLEGYRFSGIPSSGALDADCSRCHGSIPRCGQPPQHRLWRVDRKHSGGLCGGIHL